MNNDTPEARTYHHEYCGTRLRIENAVLPDGETWCPGCKKWIFAQNEVVARG